MESAGHEKTATLSGTFPLDNLSIGDATLRALSCQGVSLAHLGRQRDESPTHLVSAKRARFVKEHGGHAPESEEPRERPTVAFEVLQLLTKWSAQGIRMHTKFGFLLLLGTQSYAEWIRVGTNDEKLVKFPDLPKRRGGYSEKEATDLVKKEVYTRGVVRAMGGDREHEVRVFASQDNFEEKLDDKSRAKERFESFVGFVDSLHSVWQARGGMRGWKQESAWVDLRSEALGCCLCTAEWLALGERVRDVLVWNTLPTKQKREVFDRSELSTFPTGFMHQKVRVEEVEGAEYRRTTALLRGVCKRFWSKLSECGDDSPDGFMESVLSDLVRVRGVGKPQGMAEVLQMGEEWLDGNAVEITRDDDVDFGLRNLVGETVKELRAQHRVRVRGSHGAPKGTECLRLTFECGCESAESMIRLGKTGAVMYAEGGAQSDVRANVMLLEYVLPRPVLNLVIARDKGRLRTSTRLVFGGINVVTDVASTLMFSDAARAAAYFGLAPGKCDPMFVDSALRNAALWEDMRSNPAYEEMLGEEPCGVLAERTLNEFVAAHGLRISAYASGGKRKKFKRKEDLELQFRELKRIGGTRTLRKLAPMVIMDVGKLTPNTHVHMTTNVDWDTLSSDLAESLGMCTGKRDPSTDCHASLMHRGGMYGSCCSALNRDHDDHRACHELKLEDLRKAYSELASDFWMTSIMESVWPLKERVGLSPEECRNKADEAIDTLAAKRCFYSDSSNALEMTVITIAQRARDTFKLVQAIRYIEWMATASYWSAREDEAKEKKTVLSMAELGAKANANRVCVSGCDVCTWTEMRAWAFELRRGVGSRVDAIGPELERNVIYSLLLGCRRCCPRHREMRVQRKIQRLPTTGAGGFYTGEWSADAILPNVTTAACGPSCAYCESMRLQGRVQLQFACRDDVSRMLMVMTHTLASLPQLEPNVKITVGTNAKTVLSLLPSSIEYDTRVLCPELQGLAHTDERAKEVIGTLCTTQLARALEGGVSVCNWTPAVYLDGSLTELQLSWERLTDPGTRDLAHVKARALFFNTRGANKKRDVNAMFVELMHTIHDNNPTVTSDGTPLRMLKSAVHAGVGSKSENLIDGQGTKESDIAYNPRRPAVDLDSQHPRCIDHNTAMSLWYERSGEKHVISRIGRAADWFHSCLSTEREAWKADLSPGALAAISPDAHNVCNRVSAWNSFSKTLGRPFRLTANLKGLGTKMRQREVKFIERKRVTWSKKTSRVQRYEREKIERDSERRLQSIMRAFPNCETGPEPAPTNTTETLERLVQGWLHDPKATREWTRMKRDDKECRARTNRATGGWHVPCYTTEATRTIAGEAVYLAARSAACRWNRNA